MDNVRSLSYELLRFVDNVCREYDLSYWMDYGTLLGAVRHNDFIPWDDELNIGMMRQDYLELPGILQDQIDKCALENVVCSFDEGQKSNGRLQISCRHENLKLICINVFPYDFINGEAIEGFEDKYQQLKSEFPKDSRPINENIDLIYSQLNLTFDENEYYVPGIEGIHGKNSRFKLKIRQKRHLLPLRKLQFGKYEFSAPNDSLKYARKIYGRKKFIRIPRKKPKNNRLFEYRKIRNIEEVFKGAGDNLKRVNDDYDARQI